MAVIYCEYCHKYIDEDWNVEHFYPENAKYGCIVEEEHKEEEVRQEIIKAMAESRVNPRKGKMVMTLNPEQEESARKEVENEKYQCVKEEEDKEG